MVLEAVLKDYLAVSGKVLTIARLTSDHNKLIPCIDPVAVVLDPSVYSIHDVSGTLKAFFRRLPDPLLTSAYYQAFLDAVRK